MKLSTVFRVSSFSLGCVARNERIVGRVRVPCVKLTPRARPLGFAYALSSFGLPTFDETRMKSNRIRRSKRFGAHRHTVTEISHSETSTRGRARGTNVSGEIIRFVS